MTTVICTERQQQKRTGGTEGTEGVGSHFRSPPPPPQSFGFQKYRFREPRAITRPGQAKAHNRGQSREKQSCTYAARYKTYDSQQMTDRRSRQRASTYTKKKGAFRARVLLWKPPSSTCGNGKQPNTQPGALPFVTLNQPLNPRHPLLLYAVHVDAAWGTPM